MDQPEDLKRPKLAKKKKTKSDIDSRERLISAGEQLFSNRPFDEVSIDEICEAAQVAHGLLFHYFKSKRDFLVAVTHRVADRVDAIHLSVPAQPSSEAAIRAFMSAHMKHVSSRPASFESLLRGGYGRDHAITEIWEGNRSRSIHLLYGYLGVRNPSKSLFALIRAWFGFFDELTLSWLGDPAMEQGDVLDACIEALRSVLRCYPALKGGGDLEMSRPL